MDLLTLKLKWIVFWIEIRTEIRKFLYCNKGYHRVISHSWSSTNSRKEELKVKYIVCPVCNTMFFVSEKDRKNWRRLNDQRRSGPWRMQLGEKNVKVVYTYGFATKGKRKVKEFK